MEIVVVSHVIATLGEGPVYMPKEKLVCWVDILGKTWFAHDMNLGITIRHELPEIIGALAPIKNGEFLGAVKQGFAIFDSRGSYIELHNFLSDSERMNDAKCDALGRFWAGSTELEFKKGQGKLYRLNNNLTYDLILSGLTLPNGLGWSSDNSTFYLIDSYEKALWEFDFELSTGEIRNQRLMFDFSGMDGLPDGLCVSNEGTIYVAMWDGSNIAVITSKGEFKNEIRLPVSRPTSCTFDGNGNLLVTSASIGLNLDIEPLSGKLLAIRDLNHIGNKASKLLEQS
jgi:sugar lactone lactonase YvrE